MTPTSIKRQNEAETKTYPRDKLGMSPNVRATEVINDKSMGTPYLDVWGFGNDYRRGGVASQSTTDGGFNSVLASILPPSAMGGIPRSVQPTSRNKIILVIDHKIRLN